MQASPIVVQLETFEGGLKVLQCSVNNRTLQPVAQACSAAVQHSSEPNSQGFGGAGVIEVRGLLCKLM